MDTFMNQIMDQVLTDLHNGIDAMAKEGLKRKGFEFANQYEFMKFVKERCTAQSYKATTVYYVDGRPFLVYYENPEPVKFDFNSHQYKIDVVYGKYAYL